jgi:hypothetical protein
LLVSLPSERDKKRGQIGNILLVPELCILTGYYFTKFITFKMKLIKNLTTKFEGVDEATRTDFQFKKVVEKFTKLDPDTRCSRLNKFVSQFNQ